MAKDLQPLVHLKLTARMDIHMPVRTYTQDQMDTESAERVCVNVIDYGTPRRKSMENITADLVDGVILIWSTFRHKEILKMVPGIRWDNELRQWRLPLSWAACKQLRGVFGENLVVGQALAEWARRELETRISPALATRLDTELDSGDPSTEAKIIRSWRKRDGALNLRPFQEADVLFLQRAGSALLANEPGAGKSCSVISTLRLLHESGEVPFPCLVVCPASLKRNWEREFDLWMPGLSISVVDGGAATRRKAIKSGADVVIINYESAWRHTRLAGYGNMALTEAEKTPKELNEIKWNTVIVDEAHRLKSPRSKQARAVWWLGQGARYRFALTGTPIANNPGDLWSILRFVSPDEFPAKTMFVERYCQIAFNLFGGMEVLGIKGETREEFFSILDPMFRRMPKDLVLPQLPPKVRMIREVEMSPKQRKAYLGMQTGMMTDLDGEMLIETLPLTQRLRLVQFASASAEILEDGSVHLTTPSSKIDEMMDYLSDIGDDEPAVLFAQSRQLIELAAQRLEKEKISFVKIVGGQTTDERANAVRDFQNGRVRCFLGTVQAAGEGITLTRARHIAFLQRSDSMIGNVQAENRCHRLGSEGHESIVITDFVTTGTVEEKQAEALLLKVERLEEIVRDRQLLEIAAASGDEEASRAMQLLANEESSIMSSHI